MKYIAKQELTVFDLPVKYSNGAAYPIKLSKGQVLPIDLFDEKDIKKSLSIGGLRNLINMGFIIEVSDEKEKDALASINSSALPSEIETEQVKSLTAKKEYKSIETISQKEFSDRRDENGMVNNIDMIKNQKSIDVNSVEFESVVTEKSGGLVVTNAENKRNSESDVAHEEGGKSHNVNLNEYKTNIDFATVKSIDEFNKLNHFDQLLFVKQCEDKSLITEIINKSSKKQIQNNARMRAEALK